MRMRDDQSAVVALAKIIEKYPEIYNPNHVDYKRRVLVEKAWENVLVAVREELNDETCTLDEVKTKWKGMRSSYIRFKHKLNNESVQKVYYLYDTLQFLEPYIKFKKSVDKNDGSEMSFNDEYDENEETIQEEPIDIKPNISFDKTENTDFEEHMFNQSIPGHNSYVKRRKLDSDITNTDRAKSILDTLDGNEDLAFFISILPDVKQFTRKEKRQFRIKILQIIDDIEENKLTREREK